MGNYTYIEQGGLAEVFAEFSTNNRFGLDLETTGLNPIDSKIVLAQLGFPNGNNYVINATKVSLAPLMRYFEDRKWLKIIQNAKFEQKFIQYEYQGKIRGVFDTKIAEGLITSQLYGTSLKALAKKYLGMELDKEIRTTFGAVPMGAFSSDQLDYAAKDAEILLPIYEQQYAILKERDLLGVADLEFEVCEVVANMELTGVPIDVKKWQKTYEEARIEHAEVAQKLYNTFFDNSDMTEQMGMFERQPMNLNSPVQVKKALASIGIELPATNERVLERVKDKFPVVEDLLNYRGLQKILSSYGGTFLNQIHPFTGRIHPDFNQMGTQTGRFSCKDPNFQQLPSAFRECILDPEYAIIAADYSQIELRILAEQSGDLNFIKAFETGEDLHKATASIMFGIPIEKVTKDDRFIAKTINFGLAYGMGIDKLKDTINANSTKKVTFAESRSLVTRYKNTFTKAIFWLSDAGQLAYRRGYSETMMGRKRYFDRPAQGIAEDDFDKQVAHIKRMGANAPIQGTNADMTKMAMKDIYREVKNYFPSTNIIIQVHDEIVLLARKEEAQMVKNMVVDSMIESAKEFLKRVPVKVDAFVNPYWSKGD